MIRNKIKKLNQVRLQQQTKRKYQQNKNIYSFWGKRPNLYNKGAFLTFMGRGKKIRRKAIENLGLREGDTVLDLCCGTGLNFPYLLEKVGKTGKIIGVDLSKEMLQAARKNINKNGWQNIQLINENATKLSLLPESVDGIFSSLGISTIPNQKKALGRAKNILKENKKIVVLDAKSFSGIWKILNILIVPAYKKLALWDYKDKVIKSFAEVFLKYKIEEYNLKTIYILTGKK